MLPRSASIVVLLTVLLGGSCEKFIGRRRTVPVVHVRGNFYDVGFDVGRTFSSMIRDFVSSYENLRDFEKEYKTDAGRDAYDKTLANMKERFPYYIKEMQGVADGAKVPFYQLFLLQMDDIIGTINDNHIPRNDTGGCSSIAIKNSQNTILGHTEDAFGEVLNHIYIMVAHIIPTDEDREHGAVEEKFASLCYAGNMPGYTMGYNENGLVFSINTLSPLVLKPGHTPRTFITRAMLSAKNFSDAEKILLNEGLGIGNGFSVNMIWTDLFGGRQVYNVEVSPDLRNTRSQVNVQKYDKDPLVHCNSYLRTNVSEAMGSIIDSSEARLKTIGSHPIPKTRQDIADILSDTSDPEFKVFQERTDVVIQTVAAGIFDLDNRMWNIYIDKPNCSDPIARLPIPFSSLSYNS